VRLEKLVYELLFVFLVLELLPIRQILQIQLILDKLVRPTPVRQIAVNRKMVLILAQLQNPLKHRLRMTIIGVRIAPFEVLLLLLLVEVSDLVEEVVFEDLSGLFAVVLREEVLEEGLFGLL
jgi:hypothetical protein